MPDSSNNPDANAVSITRGRNQLHAKITSDPGYIAPVRSAVEALSTEAGFDQKAVGEIGLVVNEAIANIIRHAYDSANDQPIELTAKLENDGITITIRDWGSGKHPMPPDKPLPEKDPLMPGGLGLICMKSLMTEVLFTPQP